MSRLSASGLESPSFKNRTRFLHNPYHLGLTQTDDKSFPYYQRIHLGNTCVSQRFQWGS